MLSSRRRAWVLPVLLVGVGLGSTTRAADSPPGIREIKVESLASIHRTVCVRGVVTMREGEGFVIQDADTGIWIDVTNARRKGLWREDDSALDGVVSGADVEVTGDTSRGGFAPTIEPTAVRVLGHQALPVAAAIDVRTFFSGGADCQRVTIKGVVRRVVREGHGWGQRIALLVAIEGRCARVTIPQSECPVEPERLLDATVRCRGVATARFNARGEMLSPILNMIQGDDLTIEQFAQGGPFDAPEVPLNAIAQYRPSEADDHRIRCRGVVTMSRPGELLYLQEGVTGVRVETLSARQFQPGDIVEAAGYIDRSPLCAALVEAEVRQVAGGDPVAAIELAPDRIMDVNRLAAATFSVATPGDYFGALVRMAGRLVDTRSTPRGVESLITTDAHTFSVVADGVSATALKAVEIGSEVSITGVLRPVSRTVDDPMSPAWVSPVDRLELLPRTASDILVLAAPSWWTPRRLATLLAILAALATGAVIWAGLLRRQIAAQLRIIQSQVEARATHEERQRIAREFHDTLEQDLASIALQIDAAAHCTADEAQARLAFDQHRDMMARLRQETHDFLWDLRDKKRWDGSLGESLAAQAAYLQSLTDVRISCTIAAELPRVAADVQFHVLRIVREAVCNAIEHAKPSSIAIRAAVDGGECVITIADDGAGCDLAAAEAKTGHFGIVGMRERARRIGAALTVESGLGKGTAVTVRCQSRENTAV